MMSAEPTVFVIDDEPAVRESLRWLIRSVGIPVRAFDSAEEFLETYDENCRGCIVLDVRMPGLSGLELHERLNEDRAAPPILFITGHGDVDTAVRALKGGAFDFIEKPFSDQTLLERIQRALHIDAERYGKIAEETEIEDRMSKLTTRERQVLDIVVTGKPNKVIASELGLSQKTVEVHRAHVMQKMRAKSLAELVQMAMRVNLLG